MIVVTALKAIQVFLRMEIWIAMAFVAEMPGLIYVAYAQEETQGTLLIVTLIAMENVLVPLLLMTATSAAAEALIMNAVQDQEPA